MMAIEISEIRNAEIEPAAFTLGGKVHGVDATVEVNWRMLAAAPVGCRWEGREESQHRRMEDAATVVYRTNSTVGVLFEVWNHYDGEEHSHAALQAFHFQDGVCVAALRSA